MLCLSSFWAHLHKNKILHEPILMVFLVLGSHCLTTSKFSQARDRHYNPLIHFISHSSFTFSVFTRSLPCVLTALCVHGQLSCSKGKRLPFLRSMLCLCCSPAWLPGVAYKSFSSLPYYHAVLLTTYYYLLLTCSEKNGLFEADISSSPNPWERDAVVFIGLSIRLPREKKGSSAVQIWKANVCMCINV